MAELDEFQKLEEALIEVGRAIEYPRTPNLAARVRTELALDQPRQAARLHLRPMWIVALAVIAALAVLLIIPETREAIAQLLGLRTIRITEVPPRPPTALPQGERPITATPASATPAPTSTPGVVPFKQCCPSTLEEAQQKARFKILLPPDEQPSRVFFQDHIFGQGSEPQQVVLVFGNPDRPRMVLYEASQMLYEKLLPSSGESAGTVITTTQVNGERALWLTGAPHVLVTLDNRGEPLFEFERSVNASTLIWETGDVARGVTYRLETTSNLRGALQFAESLH